MSMMICCIALLDQSQQG
uniref:Uncharacterized protein n=1 Tax=Arundo donax TaxID=35708 RepID=A0A0A9C3Q9_ARUDO